MSRNIPESDLVEFIFQVFLQERKLSGFLAQTSPKKEGTLITEKGQKIVDNGIVKISGVSDHHYEKTRQWVEAGEEARKNGKI